MRIIDKHKEEILNDGFTIIEDVFSMDEIQQILIKINQADAAKATFRKSTELFAIRQFLKEIPDLENVLFNDRLKIIIQQLFGYKYFLVKSIFFDKPETSNWYVPYHQDLTISVDRKLQLENFGPWTRKHNQFAVQPPIDILQNIYAIRIHLDDTDESNGALKVVGKSHLKNIYRTDTIDWTEETETICRVQKGGIMIMKPLLLHSSSRVTNNMKRRVIHLEFSDQELPLELKWAERLDVYSKRN